MLILCPSCVVEKDESLFGINNATENGRQAKCRECVNRYSKEYRVLAGKVKPDGWVRKTADLVEYRKKYRAENLAKVRKLEDRAKRRARLLDPEKWRAKDRLKYERRMRRIHGDGWVPSPKLTAEQRKEIAVEYRKRKYRRWKEKYPDRYAAKLAVKSAVRSGQLVALPCWGCGAEKAHAHHVHYGLPLDVIWLCPWCHLEVHRMARECSTKNLAVFPLLNQG
jgi:hypothetical protein